MKITVNQKPRKYLGLEEGKVKLLIYNPSGVNVYLENDDVNIASETGIPIFPNEKFQMEWIGVLYLSADVNGTEIKILKSAKVTT